MTDWVTDKDSSGFYLKKISKSQNTEGIWVLLCYPLVIWFIYSMLVLYIYLLHLRRGGQEEKKKDKDISWQII